jgi:anaerobic ribonucleoside-triphosphate reductase
MPLVKFIFNRKSFICLLTGTRDSKSILEHAKIMFDNKNLIGYYTTNINMCSKCGISMASVINWKESLCLKCFEDEKTFDVLNINNQTFFEIHLFEKLTRKTPKNYYMENVCEMDPSSSVS